MKREPIITDKWKAYPWDCLELLRAIPTGSVHLILSDPPYFRVVSEEWDNQWKRPAAFLEWLEAVIVEYRRVLAPNGSLYIFAWPKMANEVESMIARHFRVLSPIVWAKPDPASEINKGAGGGGRQCKEALRAYFPGQERVIFAEHIADPTADRDRLTWQEVCAPVGQYFATERERSGLTRNEVEIALGYKSSADPERGTAISCRWEQGESLPKLTTYNALRDLLTNAAPEGQGDFLPKSYPELHRWYAACRDQFYIRREEYADLRRPFNMVADRPYSDVWTYETVCGYAGKHPCEKPLSMLTDIILTSSRPGDTVLDTFAGSFSTGVAAIRAGRVFIGGDKSVKWFDSGVVHLRAAEITAGADIGKVSSVASVKAGAEQPTLF